ncbi:MAG: FAD-dependent oxidoreductase [Gammaproteobacteria bacterium]|nr:FAD-dependent oxidoreductase [Gammaproteobacteria bacterium]
MKIAIIGGGISGLTAAYYLQGEHEITLYEANNYVGGHTDTHYVESEQGITAVDSGFIVFNSENYPIFSALLNELGVSSQTSDMSFSVCNKKTGLEYNATSVDALFCQKRNLLRPRFYRMIKDILRFYREAPALLCEHDDNLTLESYLRENRYSDVFMEDHIYPMACALWSAGPEIIMQFPARYFAAFMHNHKMLQVSDRPVWRTITGGSAAYVTALTRRFEKHIRVSTPVRRIKRNLSGVTIYTDNNEPESFDKVIIACHSDQALRILSDPGKAEREILGNIQYQKNDMVLHTDSSVMPKQKKAWASWNAAVSSQPGRACTVTYYMNLLQSLTCRQNFFVSLNMGGAIAPEHILRRRVYYHPVYTAESLRAQKRHAEINGVNSTYYCGAYWGWGFHEDGARSAVNVVKAINQRPVKYAAA